MAQYTTHSVADASLSATVALPNAANTVNTAAIDLEATSPFPTTGRFTVQITTGVATGANSKNINVALQHSAEAAANFVNIPELSIHVTTGNATNHIASTRNVVLPQSTKRYIRGTATGEANGGDSSDGNLTVKLLF